MTTAIHITRPRRVLPGFSLAWGYAVTWLSLIVLIPLAACVLKAGGLSAHEWALMLSDPRVRAALKVSFGTAAAAAAINAIVGLVIAWVLVRYQFWGRRLLDALVDFPFALPTAVAGLTFSDLFVQSAHKTGWLAAVWNPLGDRVVSAVNWVYPGALAADSLHGVYTPFAIVLVLIFTGFPFVIRTVQPVLEDLEPEIEEAAASLGATRAQTFWRVIFPTILPAWLTGLGLAFARGIGEYGAVIFVSGNIRSRTEIVPVLIVEQLDQYKYAGATALAVVLLAGSAAVLLAINLITVWRGRKR